MNDPTRPRRDWWLPAALLTALVTGGGVLVVLLAVDARWLGHALVSVAGLVAGGMVLASGATLAGRLSHPGPRTYAAHRARGLLYGSLMVTSLGVGLLLTALREKPLFGSLHGWLGLIIAAAAAFQVTSRLLLRTRPWLRKTHRWVGYGTVSLALVQSALGLAMAVTGVANVVVVGHSALGAIAGAALIWVIVETRPRGQLRMNRVRFAAWSAAIAIVAAWLLGGLQYLVVYGPQLKPVIVEGDWPWAHRILMEAKEHLFLFLPVLAATVALLLSTGDDADSAAFEGVRRAARLLAWLALLMLAMSVVFGAFISVAAHPAARFYQ